MIGHQGLQQKATEVLEALKKDRFWREYIVQTLVERSNGVPQIVAIVSRKPPSGFTIASRHFGTPVVMRILDAEQTAA